MTHSVEDAVSDGIVSKLKNEEPVLASAGVLWVLAQLGTVLVGHKIIGTEQWTSLTNTVAPIAITAILAIVAWATRSLVDSPKTSKLKTEAIATAQSALANGVLRDADFEKLADFFMSKINGYLPKNPAPVLTGNPNPGAIGTISTTVFVPPQTPPDDDTGGGVAAVVGTDPLPQQGGGEATPIADDVTAVLATGGASDGMTVPLSNSPTNSFGAPITLNSGFGSVQLVSNPPVSLGRELLSMGAPQ